MHLLLRGLKENSEFQPKNRADTAAALDIPYIRCGSTWEERMAGTCGAAGRGGQVGSSSFLTGQRDTNV